MTTAVESALSARGPSDMPAFTDARNIAYGEFFAIRPWLREFWFDDRASDGIIGVHRHNRELMCATLQQAFARFTGVTLDLLAFQVSTAVSWALFELAFRRDPRGEAVVIAGIRRFVREYFAGKLLESAPR